VRQNGNVKEVRMEKKKTWRIANGRILRKCKRSKEILTDNVQGSS